MPEDPTPAPTDPTPAPEPEVELGDAGKKAIAAERSRADKAERALKALQADADARAAAELSELERLKKERDELLNGKTASELEATRFRVALEKGLPADLAARLQGDDYDALSADADSLVALVGTKPASPHPDPSQGPKPTGGSTPAQMFADHVKSQLSR